MNDEFNGKAAFVEVLRRYTEVIELKCYAEDKLEAAEAHIRDLEERLARINAGAVDAAPRYRSARERGE